MQRKLICIVTLVCIFACMAGISASAAPSSAVTGYQLPATGYVSQFEVTPSDFISGDNKTISYIYTLNNGVISQSAHIDSVVYDNLIDGTPFKHWRATFPSTRVVTAMRAYVYNIAKFRDVDLSSYDLYVRQRLYVYIDGDYPLTDIADFSVYPLYTDSDGKLSDIDWYHRIIRNVRSTAETVTVNGKDWHRLYFDFYDDCLAVSGRWLPDGYDFSGWVYTINFVSGSVYNDPPVYICAGSAYAYSYLQSSAESDAINRQTDVISGDIRDAADAINGAINDSADRVIGEDFGYQTPDSPNTDSGLDAGNDLISDLNGKMSGFGDEINSASDTLNEGLDQTANVVTAIVGAFPSVVVALISAMIVFVVLRKVFGR